MPRPSLSVPPRARVQCTAVPLGVSTMRSSQDMQVRAGALEIGFFVE
jgi:hypothetical protein